MLPKEELRELYTGNGFVWTEHLERYYDEYYHTIRYYENMPGSLWYHPEEFILQGADHYKELTEFLGERCAPIGAVFTDRWELLLTEGGRLFGLFICYVFVWPGTSSWQETLNAISLGQKAELLTKLDFGNEDPRVYIIRGL